MVDVQTIPSVEEVDARVPPELEAYEIVDGQVVLNMGTTEPHQTLHMRLGARLQLWAEDVDAVVFDQTFDVPVSRTRRRQPDLLVVLAEHRDRIGREGMSGAPDVVIEILSRSTRHVDLGTKREEYAALGVGEYWCFDPEVGETLVFSPPDAPPRRLGRSDTLTSPRLPGLAIPLAKIFPPAA